jgi:hypothetical protein
MFYAPRCRNQCGKGEFITFIIVKITEDLPLISTSSEEAQVALVNVGSTILPILFKEALKASAILGLKIESKSS